MKVKSCASLAYLFLFAFISTMSGQQDKPYLGVWDLEAEGISKSEANLLSDRLLTELFNTHQFVVLERKKMKDILTEQGFQYSGCVSDKCIVDIGKIVGVQQMVSGRVGKIGNTYTINARLISVETGIILKTDAVDITGQIDEVLKRGCRELTWKLTGRRGNLSENSPASEVNVPPNMVKVPGGWFDMGDTFGEGAYDEQPVHRVYVNDFYMGQYEITFAKYDAFCQATGREKPDDQGWGRATRPVINISWYDAVEYCNWLSKQEGLTPCYSGGGISCNFAANGYRLPTEAEWEYAAREGGRKVRFGNGKDIADPAEINFDGRANHKENYSVVGVYLDKTTPVGSFAPNGLGLYDMSSNVWEWCWDWYQGNYYKESSEPKPRGPSRGTRRVVRGGSWNYNPNYARAAVRVNRTPGNRSHYIGFRLVRAF